MKVILLLFIFKTALAFGQAPPSTPPPVPVKASALPATTPAVPSAPGASVKAGTAVTPPAATAPKTTPPAPKIELPELTLKMVGMAYPEVDTKTSLSPLKAPELVKELEKLKLKLSYRLIDVQTFQNNPAVVATLGNVDAYVIRTYDKRLIPNADEYTSVMAADPGERCFIDAQVLTLRTSGINRLDQLKGKRIGMLERRGVYQFVMDTKLGGKEYLHGDKIDRLFQMLKTKEVDALITPTLRIGDMMFSDGSVGMWNGIESKTAPEVQAIHTTDRKLPCYFIALRRNSSPEVFYRLIDYARKEPEKAKALMLTIGGFQSLTPITHEEWTKLRLKYIYSTAYPDFLSGKVKLPGFRKLK